MKRKSDDPFDTPRGKKPRKQIRRRLTRAEVKELNRIENNGDYLILGRKEGHWPNVEGKD